MKYSITQDRIFKAVKTLSKITTNKATLPILKAIKMEVGGNTLILSSTNLDIGAVINIPVKESMEGKCAIDSSILISYLSLIPQKTKIQVELDNNNLIITSEKGVAKLNIMSEGDFPEIPGTKEDEPNRGQIKVDEFIEALKSVVFSCSNSTIRPELASVYLYNEDKKLNFVATDTFRLSEYSLENTKMNFESLLIPAKVVQEIVKIFGDEQGVIDLVLEEDQMTIKNDDIRVVARTISGNFPNYKQIIPTKEETKAVILKDDLQNALRAATIFSDKFNQINISIKSKEEKVVFESKNSIAGENTYDISGKIEGEDISLNFNYSYFSDVISSLGSGSIEMYFSGVGKPVVIREKGRDNYLYLIMPMSKN